MKREQSSRKMGFCGVGPKAPHSVLPGGLVDADMRGACFIGTAHATHERAVAEVASPDGARNQVFHQSTGDQPDLPVPPQPAALTRFRASDEDDSRYGNEPNAASTMIEWR